jgi:hypothetical protein
MEKTEGDGPKVSLKGARTNGTNRPSYMTRAFGLSGGVSTIGNVTVLPLSNLFKLALPPLFLSSLPRKAIGFSFPRGKEGKVLGVALLGATATLSYLLFGAFGAIPALAIVWLMGGTGGLMLFNSTLHGVAFVKQMCSTCRLRPIIEEHELMHLNGEPSEDVVWRETRKRYSYEGLGLGTDPKIHGFCPIAKRLKESP